MAYYGSSANAAFYGEGIGHARNPGGQNLGSITLRGALQADSDSLSPHGVLGTTVGTGSPADTDAGVEFGQQALGNRDDTEQAGQSMDRMLMQRAAGIGADDGVS